MTGLSNTDQATGATGDADRASRLLASLQPVIIGVRADGAPPVLKPGRFYGVHRT